jgi:hypothetical protein
MSGDLSAVAPPAERVSGTGATATAFVRLRIPRAEGHRIENRYATADKSIPKRSTDGRAAKRCEGRH